VKLLALERPRDMLERVEDNSTREEGRKPFCGDWLRDCVDGTYAIALAMYVRLCWQDVPVVVDGSMVTGRARTRRGCAVRSDCAGIKGLDG
jgi:hypothetical protein